MKEFLYTLLQSLNMISVSGKENMAYLLGCINAIEAQIIALDAEPVKNDGYDPGEIINEG